MLIVKTRNQIDMHIIPWREVCSQIFEQESNFHILFPHFGVFGGRHELNFLKIYIYVNKATLLLSNIFHY